MTEKPRPEIRKLAPLRCQRCGLSAPPPIVIEHQAKTMCANVAACTKRQHRNAKQETYHAGN